MNNKILAYCLSVFCFGKLQGEELEISYQPLLVSLGSHCEVAMHIAHNKMRTAAFPFDWLLTFDYKGFLLTFEDDFAVFMDRSYLYQHPAGNIINTKYNIDFRHDWPDMDFEKYFPAVRDKYERRIKRLYQLNDYPGKVYFMRAAFDLAIDPRLPTLTNECTKIDSFHAETLRNILSNKFPDLDFQLVIINYAEEQAEALVGLEQIMEFKVRKGYKKEDYTAVIQQLIEHAQYSQQPLTKDQRLGES